MSKKRSRPLGDVVRVGLVEDGELLRYVYRDQLMAVGQAREKGIEVPGSSELLSGGRFEEHAGSKLHRPNQHTLTSKGISLQAVIEASFADGNEATAHSQASSLPTHSQSKGATPLTDDPSDDFCRVCGFGGDMVCCETCPATFHMECLSLSTLPEGDWWCPCCVCAVCGKNHFEKGSLPAAAKQVIWVDTSHMAEAMQLDKPMLLPPQASGAHVDIPLAPPTGSPSATPVAHPSPTATPSAATFSAATPSAAPPSAAPTAFNPVLKGSTAPLAVKQHSRLSMVSKREEAEHNLAGSVDSPKQAHFNMAGQVLQDLGRRQKRKAPDSAAMASDTQSNFNSHVLSQNIPNTTGPRLAATVPAVSPPQSGIQAAMKEEEKSQLGRTSPTAVAVMPQQTPASGLSENQHIVEQMQTVAASAPSQQTVTDALLGHFPSSQGSSARAQKLKQFFSELMPSGSAFKDRGAALAALAGHFWNQRLSAALPLPTSKPSTTPGPVHLGSDPPTDPLSNPQQPPPTPLLPHILSALASQPTAILTVAAPSNPAHLVSSKKDGDAASSKSHLPTSSAPPAPSYRMHSPKMHLQPLAEASQGSPIRNKLDSSQAVMPGPSAQQLQTGAIQEAGSENLTSGSAQPAKQAQHNPKRSAYTGVPARQLPTTKGGVGAEVDAAGIVGHGRVELVAPGSSDLKLQGSLSEREARAAARRSRQADKAARNPSELQTEEDTPGKQRLEAPLLGASQPSAEGTAGKADAALAAQFPSAGTAGTACNTGSASTAKQAAHTRATGKSRRGSTAAAAASKAGPAKTPADPKLPGNLDPGNTPKTATQDLNAAGTARSAGSAGVKSESRTRDRSLSDREARAAARASRRAAKAAGQALQEACQAQGEPGQALSAAGQIDGEPGQAPPAAGQTHGEPDQAPPAVGQTHSEPNQALPAAGQTHGEPGEALSGAGQRHDEGGQALAGASQGPDRADQGHEDRMDSPHASAPITMPSTARLEGTAPHGMNAPLASNAVDAQAQKDSQHGPNPTPTIPQCDGAGDEEAQDTDHPHVAAAPTLPSSQSDPSADTSGGLHLSTVGVHVQFSGLQPLHSPSIVQHRPLSYPLTSAIAAPHFTGCPVQPLDSASNPPGLQHEPPPSVQGVVATLSDRPTKPPQQQHSPSPSVLEQIAARCMSQGKMQPSSSIQFTGIASDIPATHNKARSQPPSPLHSGASDARMPAQTTINQRATPSTDAALTCEQRASDPHQQQPPLQHNTTHLVVPNQATGQQPAFSSVALSQAAAQKGVPVQATAQQPAASCDAAAQSHGWTDVPAQATARQPASSSDAAAQSHRQTRMPTQATARQPALSSGAAARSHGQTDVPAQATARQPALSSGAAAPPHAQTSMPAQLTAPQLASNIDSSNAQTDALGQATARQLDAIRAQAVIVASQLSPPQASAQAGERVVQPSSHVPAKPSGQMEVTCPCSGRKRHFGCLSSQDQAQVMSEEDIWFSSSSHRAVSARMAELCSNGAMPCGQIDDSSPVTWQLVRGAAVADPQSCRGYAPRYTPSQLGALRQVLFAARHVLLDCFGSLEDSRTGDDLVPWLLQGKCMGSRTLDFSSVHVAVLSVAGVMTSVGLVRAFGPELAELPLLATRPELQGNGLAPLLLRSLETALLEAGVSRVIMPALPLPEVPLPDQAQLPGHDGTPVLKAWGSLMGYRQPCPNELLDACKFSMLQLPGTPYLVKSLSHDTLCQVICTCFVESVKIAPYLMKLLNHDTLCQVQLPRQGLRLNVKADPVLMVHNGTLTPADLPDQGIKA